MGGVGELVRRLSGAPGERGAAAGVGVLAGELLGRRRDAWGRESRTESSFLVWARGQPGQPAHPVIPSFTHSSDTRTHTHTPYPYANLQLPGTGDNTMNKVDQIPVLTELTFYPVVLAS